MGKHPASQGASGTPRKLNFSPRQLRIYLAAGRCGNRRYSPCASLSRRQSSELPRIDENAIKKGTGELAGGDLLEILYEGYGPGGVAMLVDVVSDNKNRIVAEVRHTFGKHGGNMAEAGAVSYMFNKKGVIVLIRRNSPRMI